MKQSTHYFFGIGVASLISYLTIPRLVEESTAIRITTTHLTFNITNWLLLLILVPVWAGIALLPDKLDIWSCKGLKEGKMFHCRHPYTHHPVTLSYAFVPLLIPVVEYSKIVQIIGFFLQINNHDSLNIPPRLIIYISLHIFFVWGSHLLLDALNPAGIPLGTKSIFAPRPLRHYLWSELRPNVRSWRLARIHYDNITANNVLSFIGLFTTGFVFGNEFLRSLILS